MSTDLFLMVNVMGVTNYFGSTENEDYDNQSITCRQQLQRPRLPTNSRMTFLDGSMLYIER